MGFRINTNVTSLSAQRTLGDVNNKSNDTLNRLSSGSRITKAADDAAGLAISEKLRANIRSTQQAERNANDGISLIQTAEGGLNEVSNILIRLRELAIQSASDTVGDSERQFTDLEYQNLKQEIERISQVTEFNGKKLLNGGEFGRVEGDESSEEQKRQTYDFQIGINNNDFQDRISYDPELINSGLNSLGLTEIDVQSKEGAQASLQKLDEAIQQVSGSRAELGAIQNRLSSTITNLQVSAENLSSANSRIRDTDFASETANNAKYNVLTQAGTAVLAQANVKGNAALALIG